MHRDGSFEPLTLLAEAICVTALGVAAGCALFVRHQGRSTLRRVAVTEAVAQTYAARPFTVTGPGPYRH